MPAKHSGWLWIFKQENPEKPFFAFRALWQSTELRTSKYLSSGQCFPHSANPKELKKSRYTASLFPITEWSSEERL